MGCYNVNIEDFQEAGAEEDEEELMEWYLFAEDCDQVVEDAESEEKSSPSLACLKALICLIDRALESLDHRGEAEWLTPIVLSHLLQGSEASIDPIVLETFANNHPCLEAARSARVRERDRSLESSVLPLLTEGLPWWGIKRLCQMPLG